MVMEQSTGEADGNKMSNLITDSNEYYVPTIIICIRSEEKERRRILVLKNILVTSSP